MATESELREAVSYRRHRKGEEIDCLLISDGLYWELVEKMREWSRPEDLVPWRPNLRYMGIPVQVYRNQEERMEKKMRLWDQGQRVLEVV